MPTTAAWQSADDPPPRRPPETKHHRPRLRSAAYQAAPPRRDATPTTLLPGRVLRFPRARGGRWGVDTTDTLQGGMVAPAGVTASGPKPAGISPAFQPQPPNRTEPTRQNRRPSPCANAVAPPPTPPHYEHHHEAKRTGEKLTTTGAATPTPSGREPPPPPSCGRPVPPAPSR